jgi:glycine/D-amino acid oxidase-like deaminating enzyme
MLTQPEFVVVGQGLAGTALAWALLRRGRRVLVLDREQGGCSRLAAGLVTPATGKRLAKSWRWDELYPAAVAFYRTVEADTGTRFFHQRPAVRLFADDSERDEFYRREDNILRGLVAREFPLRAGWFAAPLGGFEMPHAARLDVPRYLDVSRAHFGSCGSYQAAELDPRELKLTASGVRVPGLAGEARVVIFCRGFDASADPRFGAVRFNAAKGEILTVRVPGLAEDRVVHRGVWLAPAGNEVFRVGATYTRDQLDTQPTAEGRAEIESKLRAFLKLSFVVLDHQAAVRPVIDAGFPVLGRHPQHPQLAYFNGLGSKGSLLAPYFAEQLARHLCDGGELEKGLNVSQFLIHTESCR